MVLPLRFWRRLYEKRKSEALCVDIETTGWNGPISVLGAFRIHEGPIQVKQLVRGRDLDSENVRALFQDCRLLITFNGVNFDRKRIEREFPGCLPPGLPIIDLFLVARRLGLKARLTTLEQHFDILRNERRVWWRRKAVKLWRRYEAGGDQSALEELLEYNRNDVVNLYPLAEALLALVPLRSDRERILKALEGL